MGSTWDKLWTKEWKTKLGEVQILGKIAQSLRHLHIFNIINLNLKMSPLFPENESLDLGGNSKGCILKNSFPKGVH